MAKPKLALIPAAQGDKFYSVLPSDGVGDFTFSRASTGTRIAPTGLIEEVPSGDSRLDYDLLNGKVVNCPHYLLEPASTNLITYSEDFSQSYWNKLGSSVVSGFTSPDGTLNAYKLVEDSANSQHGLLRSNFPINVQRTLSVFAKKGENNRIFISDYNKFGATIGVIFNIEIGIVESNQNNSIYLNPKIESYPNDWYKCSVTWTNSTGLTVPFFGNAISGTNSYQGDGTSGIYVFGAMFEEQSYATSYIPTNGTAITRAAETATGSGDAATFNDSEGVLMAEIAALADDSSLRTITIGDNSSANAVSIRVDNANQIVAYVNSGGLNQCSFTSSVPTSLFNKCLIKYKANDFSAWVNGFKIGVDTSGIIFPSGTLNRLNFDIGYSSTSAFYGKTRELQYFDSVLTDAQLETLTSWTSLQEMITSQLYTNY